MKNTLMDAIMTLFDVADLDAYVESSKKEDGKRVSLHEIKQIFNSMKQSLSKAQWQSFGVKFSELDRALQALQAEKK